MIKRNEIIKLNDLQKCQLEMLKVFINVCEKLGLKYYLICGSALGAVKYGGFIPWDDDIDVGLMREDYDKLIKYGPSLFPDYLFLQSYKTDSNYPLIFAKLRNSNTTYIEKGLSKLDINHGVYIDIFPLDYYPSSKINQIVLEVKKWIYSRQIATAFNIKRSLLGNIIKYFFVFLGYNKKIGKVVKKYEKTIAYYKGKRSNIICNHGNWQGRLDYSPKSHFGDGVLVLFCGLEVRVPVNYDTYLTQKYGKWKEDLPEDQKYGHHFFEICDLKKSYKYYIKKLSNGRIETIIKRDKNT